MKDTSLEAYKIITYDGTKEKQINKVFGYIQNNPDCSRLDISKGMNIPINAICGRCNELLDKGLVRISGHKISSTGKRVESLKAV